MSAETGDSQTAPAAPSDARATDSVAQAPAPPLVRRALRLNTKRNVRASLARIIREFDRLAAPSGGDIGKFRATVHAMSVLLAYDKAIEEDEIAARLDAIEARLAEHGRTAA